MVIYSVTGWSGSGKTTLISDLTQWFSSRGKRVFVVKKVTKKYHLEPEGKDSLKFLKAGASESVVFAQGELLRMSSISSHEEGFEKIRESFSDYDVVLMEGVREAGIPVVEVYDPELNKGMKFDLSELAALITDSSESFSVPVFRRDNIKDIARFMEENHG